MTEIKSGIVNDHTLTTTATLFTNSSPKHLDLSKLGKLDVGYKSRTRDASPHGKTTKELFDMSNTEASLLDQRIAKSRLIHH